jgi:hypothetical protein
MDLITIILTLVLFLKLVATSHAIEWIKAHGQEYIEKLHNNTSQKSNQDYYALFAASQGDFFPFGVKDYKLRQVAERSKSSWNPIFIMASLFHGCFGTKG